MVASSKGAKEPQGFDIRSRAAPKVGTWVDKTWVVMPAYNAAITLERTLKDLPKELQGRVILVDDASTDGTYELATELGIVAIRHPVNRGYGANQKTCYTAALEAGAEFIIMVHPDFQYDARMAAIMANILALGNCDIVLGNRIRTRREAIQGGMPRWKYFANRASTLVENFILGQSIGDFHTGMRAYTRVFLQSVPYLENSDDFTFDQELLVQAVAFGFRIGDVPVPVRYMNESSSISFRRSLDYARGGAWAISSLGMHRMRLRNDPRFVRR